MRLPCLQISAASGEPNSGSNDRRGQYPATFAHVGPLRLATNLPSCFNRHQQNSCIMGCMTQIVTPGRPGAASPFGCAGATGRGSA
jgi:hypothetical protein